MPVCCISPESTSSQQCIEKINKLIHGFGEAYIFTLPCIQWVYKKWKVVSLV